MSRIISVKGRELLDSRGNPTVEAVVVTELGAEGSAIVPSGASKGKYEALELRDNDQKRFKGKGVLKAVGNIERYLEPELLEVEVSNQRSIDYIMKEVDGTQNKSKVGANAILAVSLACSRAAAEESGLPLYRYLGGVDSYILPVPMMNLINGGEHADNNLDIQEFMIVPIGFEKFSEALRAGSEVFHTLKAILKSEKLSTAVGDEGGFAPSLDTNESALKLLVKAIEEAGYQPGKHIFLALDSAASSFFDEKEKKYVLKGENRVLNSKELINFYSSLIDSYPICSLEDPLAEEDYEGWAKITESLGDKVMIIGDDIFVTSVERIEKGLKENLANSVLIKLNQIGTLSETIDAVRLTQTNGWKTVVSHRSGETEDPFIADFSVAVRSGFIKTGSVSRSERIAKYNRLLRIEEELGREGLYFGRVLQKNNNK